MTSRSLIAQMLEAGPDALRKANSDLLRVISRDFSRSMDEAELEGLLVCASHRASIDCPGWYNNIGANGGDLDFGSLDCCLAE